MPRLIRAVPKYRKHRATGQAIVTIGRQAHYLGPHGSHVSRDQYDRIIAEYLASSRNQRRLVRIFKWASSNELVGPETWQALSSVEGLRKGRTIAAEWWRAG